MVAERPFLFSNNPYLTVPLLRIFNFMNRILIAFTLFIISSCNNSSGYKKPESALDAGREFIQYSLKGKFETAKKYMYQDNENNYWLQQVILQYNKTSEEEKSNLQKASIHIAEVADVSDSVTVINYSNSYKKSATKVKVIKKNGEWMVDFKYTFSGNL